MPSSASEWMSTESPPAGPPDYGWFDGVLDGKIADETVLHELARGWTSLMSEEPLLKIDGASFTFLPSDATVDGARMDTASQSSVLATLRRFCKDGARPDTVESTLRCTMVYGEQVVETLFGVVGGDLRSVSRARPVSPSDIARQPRPTVLPESVRSLGIRRALTIGVLVLCVFGVTAWRSGWLGRVLALPAEELVFDPGPFASMLEADVQSRWGTYEVELRRGSDYPANATAGQSLIDVAPDNARRAAVALVTRGDTIYVQLINKDTLVLAESEIVLRKLLTDPSGTVHTDLPGRISAVGYRLSISSDEP